MKAAALLLGLDRPRRAVTFILLVLGSFLACAFLFPPLPAACGCIFLFGMIAGCCVDFDQMILPDMFTVGLAVVGVALSLLVPALHGLGAPGLFNGLRSGAAALLGAALGSALGMWIGILGELALDREVLGFGDVKFLGAIGAFCGWRGAIFALFGGAAVAVLVLLLGGVFGRPRSAAVAEGTAEAGADNGGGRPFPFGPMLAIAAALYFFAFHGRVDAYLSQYLIFF
jgi:leader peptidase (prepilin peptidase)/N-methyltransferase